MKHFLFIIVILAIFIPLVSHASMELDLQSPFPGSGTTINIDENSLGNYIKALYNYGVSLVAVLAVVMIMYGGFKWIFAAGNVNTIQGAKSTIISAIIGLVLALSSYLLLQAINPDLVVFKPLIVEKPEIKFTGCPGVVTSCDSINNLTVPNDRSSDGDQDTYYYQYVTSFVDEGKSEELGKKTMQRDVCISPYMMTECGLPQFLCYWGSEDQSEPSNLNNDDYKCRPITEKDCDNDGITDPKCRIDYNHLITDECEDDQCGPKDLRDNSGYSAMPQYCETDGDNNCSLGVVGSNCEEDVSCNQSLGLKCVNDYCRRVTGDEGSPCEDNNQCNSGLVCGDNSPIENICVKATPCNVVANCASGNYFIAPNLSSTECANNYCDCESDDDCLDGYECVDTMNGNGFDDNDVCWPE